MSDCIEYQGARDRDGYGKRKYRGRMEQAPRVAFFEANGYWPNICRHTCDNPPCINPEHLLDGTPSDNALDSVERGRHVEIRKTHCPQGHPYTPNNTYVENKKNGRVARQCVICRNGATIKSNERARLRRIAVRKDESKS